MKKLTLALSFALAGCATGSPKEVAVAIPMKPVPKMSVAGMTIDQLGSSSCPQTLDKSGTVSEYVKWGSACAKAGQWNRVEEAGNALSVQHPAYPWGAYFLSVHAEHEKDLPRARWMAELAAKKAPNEGMTLYQLGRIQWLMEEKNGALDTLTKAVDKNPTLADAHALLGEIALLSDRNSEAQKRFQRAIEQNSKHVAALLGLAEVATRGKNWVEAQTHLRTAVSVAPKNTEAKARLQFVNANVTEEMKRRLSERTPTAQTERKAAQ